MRPFHPLVRTLICPPSLGMGPIIDDAIHYRYHDTTPGPRWLVTGMGPS